MKRIPVGILGATGSVGQKFVELLQDHPWFEISALAASERSAGKRYADSVPWIQQTPLASNIANMQIRNCEPDLPCRIVFSGLDSSVAGELEITFADAGYYVLSNSRNHRMDPDVPLLVSEINSDHLQLLERQTYKGAILTNPNCSATGLVLALKPLLDCFGLEAVHVVTMQALSGAGFPGVSSLSILDNVIPFISGEEKKVETEPLKILGRYKNGSIRNLDLKISAQCNRVSVFDGHTECVSVKLSRTISEQEIIREWNDFSGEPQELKLPSAPERPIHYLPEKDSPQPRLHRNVEKGMAVTIGRLRPCSLFDYKFVLLSHNTIRGAAGGAILNAELIVKKRIFPHDLDI
ncbi:aspartate-semialdehyde dehydrogenase [bacterium]|nr:aspartate-semialdehyde dehydrogenase [bacterium]MCI0603528.1 aspartate-semialdehyde dehydrogenase [bacterium]